MSEQLTLEARRQRAKIDVEQLDAQEAERRGLELGKQVGIITENAKEAIQKLVSIYGLEVQIQAVIKDPKTGTIFTP